MLRLAVFASGGGSNLQSILDAAEAGELGSFTPALVVADRECGAVSRAMEAGVDAVLLDRKIHRSGLSRAAESLLLEYEIDFVALAGWLSILDEKFTSAWAGRIVNIHPSLLPRHGGKGMYGIRVHRAVLEAGESESGCSIHFVTAGVDEGDIISQARVPVEAGDTPEKLAARILPEEHRLYPETLRELSMGLPPRS